MSNEQELFDKLFEVINDYANILIGVAGRWQQGSKIIVKAANGRNIEATCLGDGNPGDCLLVKDEFNQWYAVSQNRNRVLQTSVVTNRKYNKASVYRPERVREEVYEYPVKVLFTRYVTDNNNTTVQKVYIGGDRAEPLEVFEVPGNVSITGGGISNTGKGKLDWIAGIKYGSYETPTIKTFYGKTPDSNWTIPANQNNIELTWYGYGFWSTYQESRPEVNNPGYGGFEYNPDTQTWVPAYDVEITGSDPYGGFQVLDVYGSAIPFENYFYCVESYPNANFASYGYTACKRYAASGPLHFEGEHKKKARATFNPGRSYNFSGTIAIEKGRKATLDYTPPTPSNLDYTPEGCNPQTGGNVVSGQKTQQRQSSYTNDYDLESIESQVVSFSAFNGTLKPNISTYKYFRKYESTYNFIGYLYGVMILAEWVRCTFYGYIGGGSSYDQHIWLGDRYPIVYVPDQINQSNHFDFYEEYEVDIDVLPGMPEKTKKSGPPNNPDYKRVTPLQAGADASTPLITDIGIYSVNETKSTGENTNTYTAKIYLNYKGAKSEILDNLDNSLPFSNPYFNQNPYNVYEGNLSVETKQGVSKPIFYNIEDLSQLFDHGGETTSGSELGKLFNGVIGIYDYTPVTGGVMPVRRPELKTVKACGLGEFHTVYGASYYPIEKVVT